MTGGEIADLVAAGVGVLGALAAWLSAQSAHRKISAAGKAGATAAPDIAPRFSDPR